MEDAIPPTTKVVDLLAYFLMKKTKDDNEKILFEKFKQSIINLDPVTFCQKYLSVEGRPMKFTSGWKPFSDIYRYIGIKALERGSDSKPVIIVKGRQVGGTTMAQALEMYFMGCGSFGIGSKPPIRIIHAFPQLEQAAVYSKTKLNPMINSSFISPEDLKNNGKVKTYMQKMLDQTSSTGDSLSFKQFINGNYLWVDSTGIDADRLRGRSCDVIFYDEIQDMPGAAIANANKILSKANYGRVGDGVQVYFGTPKKKGSDFYKMWESSSQQYFYLGCEKCKKHFPLYTPGSDDWEKIWLYEFIVKCTHCGFEQNKVEAADRGKWVGLKNSNDSQLIGFHINQLYIPEFPKEKIISEKPENHPINSERIYRNEVLGEFFHGDSSPISSEEIRDYCGDYGRKMSNGIQPNKDIVVMGIDYGAKSDIEQMVDVKGKQKGQSFSTAVILLVKGPNLFSIEYALKFKKNDQEFKKNIIDNLMRKYSVNLAVGDIGYSNDFSANLANSYGNKYLVSRAMGKLNSKIKFVDDAFPKEIQFDRNVYIGEMFELMKNGQVRFPMGDFEKIAWLIEHCASMDIKASISKYGDPSLNYVKGSTPNDGLMALINAFIAYKFIVTDGFKTNNPLLEKANVNNSKPLVMTGVITRKF